MRRAAAGDVITITDRGTPVAQIVPLRVSRLEAMRNAGLVRRATTSAADLPLPTVEITDGSSLGDTLGAMRDDERD